MTTTRELAAELAHMRARSEALHDLIVAPAVPKVRWRKVRQYVPVPADPQPVAPKRSPRTPADPKIAEGRRAMYGEYRAARRETRGR